MSDAERIARLQRSIKEAADQIGALTESLGEPESEYAIAQSTFAKLDRQLAEAGEAGGERAEELKQKHALAKERFDIAIRERKTLQEQIATLQQKLASDQEALRRLTGDAKAEPAAVAAAAATVPTARPAAGAPADGGVKPEPAAPTLPVAMQNPLAPAPETAASPPAATGEPARKVAPEVAAARREADRREAEAASAQAEVASVEDRIASRQKSIELEEKLFQSSRRKVENARATEQKLYETLEKRRNDDAPQDELAALRKQIADARGRLREAETESRERTDRLQEYQRELTSLQTERLVALEEARTREGEADQAARRVAKLESPLSPQNLWRWLLERGPRVAGIILAMIVILWVARPAEKRLVSLMAGRRDDNTPADRENRAKTLVGVFHSAVAVAVYAGGALMILTEVGVNIVPLMGGAAVLGLAVAFGAQNLIRDYFYGFMILLENPVRH